MLSTSRCRFGLLTASFLTHPSIPPTSSCTQAQPRQQAYRCFTSHRSCNSDSTNSKRCAAEWAGGGVFARTLPRYAAAPSAGGPAHSHTSNHSGGGGKAKKQTDDELIAGTRNIGIVAHIDAGKTTTTERMLFYAGVTQRVGEVDAGTATTDYMKEEAERGITIQSAAVSLRWRGASLNLIDTPGHVDFTVEVERALRVVDGVVALFDASAGVQAQSYTVLQQSRKFGTPVIAFINKMDKFNADFTAAVESIRAKLGVEPLVLQVPLHASDGDFEGVVDIIEGKSYRFLGKNGSEVRETDLRLGSGHTSTNAANSKQEEEEEGEQKEEEEYEHVRGQAARARAKLIAQLTALDDTLSEAFIHLLDATDGDEAAAEAQLPADAIRGAVRRLTLRPAKNALPVMPVLCGASRRDQGVQPLLDAIVHYLPSPRDRALEGRSRTGAPVPLPPASTAPHVPTVALAFKVTHAVDPVSGRRLPLVYLRVYSGLLRPRTTLVNHSRGGRTERVDRLYTLHADRPVEVEEGLRAGQIGAAFLAEAATGDTLFAAPAAHRALHARPHLRPTDEAEEVYTLEGISSPQAVIAFSIEAENRHHMERLQTALAELTREDPSLRVRTDDLGNTVLSGMGELHLEIIMSRLANEHRVRCRLLRAVVEYRESATEGAALEGVVGTQNELPFMECSLRLVPLLGVPSGDGERCEVSSGLSFRFAESYAEAFMQGAAPSSARGGGGGRDKRALREEMRAIERCFTDATAAVQRLGPLAGLPLHGLAVELSHFRLLGSAHSGGGGGGGGGGALPEKAVTQCARGLIAQLVRSVPRSSLVLLEPMMEAQVHLSEDGYARDVVSSLNAHKALTVDMGADGRSVTAVVALRNIVRYTMELRKVVKGHASLFTKLDHYRVILDKAVVARILKNLGITEQP